MNEKFLSSHLDFFGFSASMLCAVHCVALPIILSLGIAGNWNWLHNPYIEGGFILLALVFATSSLLPSYRKVHQNPNALAMLTGGFALIISSHTLWHEQEGILMAIGGCLIAAAHFVNWRQVQQYNSCSC